MTGRLAAGVFAALAAVAPACRRAPSACGGGARFELVAPRAPVGFDTEVTVEAHLRCAEARAGTIAWRQVAGPAGAALVPADAGFAARARTPTLAAAFGAPLPWGIVPLSPRTRGALTLEATWSDGEGASERHQVTVFAAARARGLPNMAVGARVYLGGSGWHLDARPPASAAALEREGGVTSLLPDVAGDWRLVDGAGRVLTLRSARYDETPLDCGRSECHAAIAAASALSPMTTVLARGLAPAPGGHGAAFGDAYPGCALTCHATSEPGVHDGGFVDVMRELGVASLGARPWETVPRALRRLGGVGCLACHGPAALPEASARWSILRADVCATCHDAPPRYGHVAAWRTTGMARADRDPRAAREPACARCHTTAGFLARGDASVAGEVNRRPPPDVGPVGITCAACHAVHAHGPAAGRVSGPALLRATPRPALLAYSALPATSAGSGVCLDCHTPTPDEPAPSATAAALWLGQGGLEPMTGVALAGPTPHAAVTGGCVGCHAAGPAGLERGAGHGFVAGTASCGSCHPRALPPDNLRARAQRLWATWRARTKDAVHDATDDAPPHARAVRLDRATPLGRAAWDLSLVLEDPAAAAHNAPYARLLLAAAERALNPASTPVGRGGHP